MILFTTCTFTIYIINCYCYYYFPLRLIDRLLFPWSAMKIKKPKNITKTITVIQLLKKKNLIAINQMNYRLLS